jgi:hypothetical protein
MKNMFESAETFTAYATIEYGYWAIKKIFDDAPKRSGIVLAIDKATGYDKVVDKKLAEQLIPILKDIIRAKKIIEADYSKDVELIEKSKDCLNSEQNPERSIATKMPNEPNDHKK